LITELVFFFVIIQKPMEKSYWVLENQCDAKFRLACKVMSPIY